MSNAEKVRQVFRRLARRQRREKTQSLRHQSRSPELPDQEARRGQSKKSPFAPTVPKLAQLWTRSARYPQQKKPVEEIAKVCGNIPAAAIHPAQIAAVVATWKTRLAPSTQRIYVGQAKAFLKTAERPDLAQLLPKIRGSKRHAALAAPGEAQRLIASAPPWLRAMLTIATCTAMRRGDCARLKATDIKDGNLTITQQKTTRTLTLPAAPELLALIENAPPGDPATPIVERYAGKPVSTAMIDHAMKKAKKTSGVNQNLTMHSFRHTMAATLYDLTKDLRAVQHLLGHDSLMTTAQYLEHHDHATLHPLIAQLWVPKGKVQ